MNYHIHCVDIMLAGDRKTAFSLQCCWALITILWKHRALIVIRPLSLWPTLFSLLTMIFRKKKHLVIFLFILVWPPKVLLFAFPWCPVSHYECLASMKSELCAGLSVRSVILILSNRG